MFNQRKKATPSPLPTAEHQESPVADDGDVSVYNSKPSSPAAARFASDSSLNEKDEGDSEHEPSSLKRLHKHSKSSIPYAVSENNASFSKSKGKKNSLLALGTPRGFSSAVSLVKQTLTDSGNTTFALVIIVLIFFLVFTDPSLSSFFGTKHQPIQGILPDVVSVNTPFIVPEVPKFFHEKASTPGSAAGGSSGDGPKKAPGDYAKDLTNEKAPHAAMANNPDKTDKTDKTGKDSTEKSNKPSAQELAALKKNVGAMVFKDSTPTPPLIIVLALNPEKYKQEYLERIIENRRKYALKHGLGLYVRYVTDFKDEWSTSFSGKSSWAKLPIMRAAFHAFPKAKHFWYLDHNAVIVNMDISILDQIIAPPSLTSIMLKDIPVVPNSQVVRTYKNTLAEKVHFIVTQDQFGLNPSSFIFANMDIDKGEFAKAFLDYWNDPLSREYKSFDRSEASALNHILQWHPVFLSRSAVISPRRMAALTVVPNQAFSKSYTYVAGDFVAVLANCQESSSLGCMKELAGFIAF